MPEQDAQPQNTPSANETAETPPACQPAVADLASELTAVQDRLLRALAEQENIRRQAQRDRDAAVNYAAAGFAGDLLSAIDNLERAIASVQDKPAELVVAGLLTGVDATRRALLDTFARHGLKRLDPLGEKFDPHWHEAVFEADDARYPPGSVTQIVQPGYMYRDRLLRPARVGVNKTSAQHDPSIASDETLPPQAGRA